MLCAALAAAAPQSLAAAEPPTSGSAVIIGNRDQEAPYAHRDATAFERFVLDVHRFDPDRIALLRDASEAEITLAFQTAVHREAPVMLVYFSGRDVRGTAGGRGPVRLLLDNIAKANARSVWVFLDTSSASKADRGLLRSFPQGPDRELTALVAASPNETASSDEGTRQGLFTRHLLDALYGWADDDGDGHVTAREAKAYLDDTMTPHARRELGTTQTASLMGTRDAVLATERAVPAVDPPPAPATPGGARTAASRAPARPPCKSRWCCRSAAVSAGSYSGDSLRHGSMSARWTAFSDHARGPPSSGGKQRMRNRRPGIWTPRARKRCSRQAGWRFPPSHRYRGEGRPRRSARRHPLRNPPGRRLLW